MVRSEAAQIPATITQPTLMAARTEILQLHMGASVEEYLVQLINATRRPANYNSDTPKSTWDDYDKTLISPGGGVSNAMQKPL